MSATGEKSIVLELQRLASEKSTDVSELLRKSLIVATKLKLDEFKAWVLRELRGYDTEEVPPYRRLHWEVRVQNPIRGGSDPVILPREILDIVQDVPFRGPISLCVSAVEGKDRHGEVVQMPMPEQLMLLIVRGLRRPAEPILLSSVFQLQKILDAVRTTILEWSLKLEAEGIVGEGLSFSPEEKERAAATMHVSIGGNFQGILGDVSGSTVTQNLKMSVNAGDFASLKRSLKEVGVEAADLAELERAIGADPKPNERGRFGAQVSQWVGTMVGKAASGAWSVGTDAAGAVLTKALLAYYGFND